MITQFHISNFKRLQSVSLELGNASVFIGPNNSGKTTALQALALWDMGWRRWVEKRDDSSASKRQGVAINLAKNDLVDQAERSQRLDVLQTSLDELIGALRITGKPDPWGPGIKVTDDFLDLLFKRYFERLGTPQQIFKRDYHGMADAISLQDIDVEVTQVLDALWEVAQRANPAP